MQYFSRSAEPPPDYFRTERAQSWRKRLLEYFSQDESRQVQELVGRSSLSLNDEGLLSALGRLFRGKCAFCERRVPLVIHRFRPETEATPFGRSTIPHLYYVWLAEAWENLYPICEDCRPNRPDYFPVRYGRCYLPKLEEIHRFVEEGSGQWRQHPPVETPLLLDPCDDQDYTRNVGVMRDGRLVGKSKRGVETIEHFNLNRDGLVKDRAKAFSHYLDGLRVPELQSKDGSPLGFLELEFGGSWYLLLRQLAIALGSNTAETTRAKIDGFYARFVSSPEQLDRIAPAFERMDADLKRQAKAVTVSAGPRSGVGRLQSVEITNFKALERLRITLPTPVPVSGDDPLAAATPCLLIIGENAAGKTSLLEAIALALSDETIIDRLGLQPRRYMLEEGMLGGSVKVRPSRVQLTFVDGAQCSLSIASLPRGFQHNWDHREQAPPVFAYGAFRQFQKTAKLFSVQKHVNSLFDSEYILSNPQRWLLKLKDNEFNMVVRQLRSIFAIGSDDFDVIERDGERCYVRQRVAAADGTVVETRWPLAVVSSGFRTILAMVLDVMNGLMNSRVYQGFESLRQASAVVLIDEIEAHLHPRWKMQIMRGLREALPNVTFIATTHDPLCMRAMNDQEVVVLRRVASGTEHDTALPVFVESDADLPPISQLTLDQLLTSDVFQLFSTDSVVVERELAHVADLLARQNAGDKDFSQDEREVLAKFSNDVSDALPVGSNETQRVVQDALAEHLKGRRGASKDQLEKLSKTTRRRITQALEKL